MYRKQLIFLIVVGMFYSCGIAPRTLATNDDESSKKPAETNTPPSPKKRPSLSTPTPVLPKEIFSNTEISKNLEIAYNDWKGIPYLLGGTGYEGVDCSSFMQIVFEDHFGITLPRTTRQQIKEGKKVRRSNIKEGDLIFFRTSKTEMHVGVAKDSKQFIHASTSRGVMISSLDDNYWSQRYLETRRIL